jgi:hypothetical protein
MRRARYLVGAAALAVGAVAVGDAAPATADHRNFRVMATVLRGRNEVPPADPDGFGASGVTINVSRGRLCYFVSAAKIQPATLAHIHRGAAGVNGGIVVPLEAPDDGFSAACLSGLDQGLLGEIVDNPSGFYVNVHNAEFPGGAIRGQLH